MIQQHKFFLFIAAAVFTCSACKKSDSSGGGGTTPAENFDFKEVRINGTATALNVNNVNFSPSIKFLFSSKVDHSSVPGGITFTSSTGTTVTFNTAYENSDSAVVIQPSSSLVAITKYTVVLSTALKSQKGKPLSSAISLQFITSIDSSDKFPVISDNLLLDKIQQQTFKYFWDFGHPVSGMARERNTSGDVVTTGGTGFGIMAMIAASSRNFITKPEAATRILKIVDFLKNNCTTYHGAFAHWINGATGATIPFSTNDNGADLVETSYLMEGLITAREYFNTADATETDLRNKINLLWNNVDWNWFRQSNQNVLYWHWSPDKLWIMNFPVSGWNEALITYVLAASSTTSTIPTIVYTNGWAKNGAIKNNNIYFGYQLPLGPDKGGPLFFEHYSFLGIDPNGLNDTYANYQTQTTNHTKINYEYCKANPHGWYGYSNLCWGLTASDVPNGYNANEPNNDIGVITPTAAISSMPYTPTESMNALKFFYYKLGDKLWGQYGFYDAFKLSDPWFASSTLAIDQGPIIVMIENYRTGLLWNLFTGAPEIKNGMRQLGFTAPYL
jgi:hypothetical protein